MLGAVPYTPIIGTLGYVLSAERDRVLLIHRTRPGDHAFGKWNGLGGKLEPDEDVAAGMVREIREEAGIEATSLVLRGTVSWPGFGPAGEDWLGFVFLVDGWEGTPLEAVDEGTLEWVPVAELAGPSPALDLWPGDRHFLPLVFGDDPRQFHGVMPYRDGQPTGWSYTLV
jgi:8-oxo-dGTP diphosphatase